MMINITELDKILHDLNQPLSIILGNIELLEMKCDKGGEYIKAINKGVEKLQKTVMELKEYCETLQRSE